MSNDNNKKPGWYNEKGELIRQGTTYNEWDNLADKYIASEKENKKLQEEIQKLEAKNLRYRELGISRSNEFCALLNVDHDYKDTKRVKEGIQKLTKQNSDYKTNEQIRELKIANMTIEIKELKEEILELENATIRSEILDHEINNALAYIDDEVLANMTDCAIDRTPFIKIKDLLMN